jgi:hypothetical protein
MTLKDFLTTRSPLTRVMVFADGELASVTVDGFEYAVECHPESKPATYVAAQVVDDTIVTEDGTTFLTTDHTMLGRFEPYVAATAEAALDQDVLVPSAQTSDL